MGDPMSPLPFLMSIWFIALVLFLVANFGYLFLAFGLAIIKRKTVQKSDNFAPFISILIPCYNVASVIKRKIENALDIEYPEANFEIVVVESGSTDNTLSILSKYVSQGKIKLIKQSERLGKASAINQGLRECESDIVILTDAEASLERKAVKELVKNFADESIGAVVGNLTITPGKSTSSKMNHLFYQIFRQRLRIWESMFDSASFWSGELCAFRKSLVERLDEDIVNDDRYILLKIRSKGYRCICEPLSHVHEPDAENVLGQLMHKRRTTAGTIQGTVRFKHMLFNPKYGLFGTLILPSHFFRVILLPVLLVVVEALSPIAVLFLWSSTGLFCLGAGVMALVLLSLFKGGRRLLSSLFYGSFVQVAILAGIADYILKRYSVLWTQIAKP
jgi:cellulose synthase/poly-beta-1,6-N-acetylglucosamine synthase-like glycosyltransferase